VTNAVTLSSAAATGFLRNRIINGAMVIDQRNNGASVTPTASTYIVDRWEFQCTQSSKVALQRASGISSQGFTNSLSAFVSATVPSPGGTDYFAIRQAVEGFNCSDFFWGTASAQTVTMSFWVQSSVTGTFGGAFSNSSINRSYPFTYTISAANTWEKKTITVAGDTSGTWLQTNGVGINIFFSLCTGSTYSGTAGAWGGAFYASATGATNLLATSSASFYLTGVQLEVGTVATPFEREIITNTLAKCQRYYQKTFPLATVPASNIGTLGAVFGSSSVSNVSFSVTRSFLVQMRASPTMVYYSTNQAGSNWSEQSGSVPTLTDLGAMDSSVSLRATGSISPGGAHSIHFTASAEL